MVTVGATADETALVRYARWSLYVTVGCLPLYVVRWHYGPLPTTLLETLILITVALYVVARWREGQRRPVMTRYEIPIVVLLLAGAVSIFVAKDHRGAIGLYRAYFVEPVLIFYVAVDLVRRAEHVAAVLLAFAIGSSIFAVLNLIVFTQALLAHAVHVGTAPNALYGDANYVAMYLEPPVAMAIGLILFATTPRWRAAGAVWFVITATALLLTFSKGSWLALGGVVFAMALSVSRWGVPILLGSAVVAFLISRIPLIAQRLSLTDVSIGGRLSLVNGTLKMLRGSPLFGFGLGGYSFQFRGQVPEIYPHNIWLTFWVEIGLIGVIAFAVILFALLWQGWRAWAHAGETYRPAAWGASAALVAWFVHGFVDSPYWKNDLSTEFWILAALIVVASTAVARTRAHAS